MEDELYYRLRRLLTGPAILRLRTGRSYRTIGLKWGEDDDGFYAELPVSDLIRADGELPEWSVEWARPTDIAEIMDGPTGAVLYRQDSP
jgi:hypothetical protein